jgi:2-hydroxychromene-2-carboxylate isomerase
VHDVRFYFDFLSPYSALALLRAEAFAEEHAVRWHVRPVMLSAILDAAGLPGGAEVPAKRAFVAQDVARRASELGLEIVGPPELPFLSFDALRVATLFADDPRALALCVALTRAAWCEGRALTEPAVLADAVSSVGLDAEDLARRILDRAVKRRLRAFTDEAIAAGAFGVPTFAWEGELFWGQDRLDQLAGRLAGRIPPPRVQAEAFLAKPSGFDRRKLGAP